MPFQEYLKQVVGGSIPIRAKASKPRIRTVQKIVKVPETKEVIKYKRRPADIRRIEELEMQTKQWEETAEKWKRDAETLSKELEQVKTEKTKPGEMTPPKQKISWFRRLFGRWL